MSVQTRLMPKVQIITVSSPSQSADSTSTRHDDVKRSVAQFTMAMRLHDAKSQNSTCHDMLCASQAQEVTMTDSVVCSVHRQGCVEGTGPVLAQARGLQGGLGRSERRSQEGPRRLVHVLQQAVQHRWQGHSGGIEPLNVDRSAKEN